MPIVRELNERMTMNVQDWKKKKLQEIAVEKGLSDSKLLLNIVDEWYERHYGRAD